MIKLDTNEKQNDMMPLKILGFVHCKKRKNITLSPSSGAFNGSMADCSSDPNVESEHADLIVNILY